jgi:hypothetical protein
MSTGADKFGIVRRDDDRASLRRHLQQRGRKIATARVIERRSRLVHQQYAWLDGQRSRDCYPLRFASRQLVGHCVGTAPDAKHLEQLPGATLGGATRLPEDMYRRQPDVLQGSHVREKMVKLKHHADRAVQLR